MNNDHMLFEASGGKTDESAWTYKLVIRQNSTFKLDFHLKNWTNASIDDWVYDGNYTLSFSFGSYILTFNNIIKSGESQVKGNLPKTLKPEPYTKSMSVTISIDGSCELKKDNWGVYMKGAAFNVDNVKSFFFTVDPHLDTSARGIVGSFSGDTTSAEDEAYDSWIVCHDRFTFEADGRYEHHHTYANHDYDSGWQNRGSGRYSLNADGKTISAGTHNLTIKTTNGSIESLNWNGYILTKSS